MGSGRIKSMTRGKGEGTYEKVPYAGSGDEDGSALTGAMQANLSLKGFLLGGI